MAESSINKLFSDTIFYSIGNILNRFIAFLLLPLYTHYFNPAEFGIFSLVYAFWFFVAVVYLYGMETAFQKFFIEEKDFQKQKSIYSTVLIQIFITSVIFSTTIYFSSDFISKILTGDVTNSILVKWLAIVIIFDALSRFPMILINAKQLSKVYTIINLISVIINLLCNIIFIVFLKLGIVSIFYSFLISYISLFVISFFYCKQYFVLKYIFNEVKSLFKFSHNFIYYGIFLISLDLIDRFFLGYYKSNQDVGIYSACYRIGMIMNLLISGFRTAWFPFFLKLKDQENNKEIFSKIFTLFTLGGLMIFLFISLFSDDLVKIHFGKFWLLDPAYWSGLYILPFILLSYLLNGLFLNMNVASYFENKIKYLVISVAIGSISNIIFNIMFIPKYSIFGAALATFLSYLLMFITLYSLSQKKYYIKYEWNKITIITLIAIVLYLISFYLSQIVFDNLVSFLLKVAIFAIFSIILYKFNFFQNLAKSKFK